ncbi:hypothetical protein LTS17_012011 [Exophiala oligosperma]
MPTPQDAFSRLSLESYLAFEDSRCNLQHRRREVWDILSSFDGWRFAIEFRPADWDKVTEVQRNSALTIPGDLEGTMLYRGCHDVAAWQALNKALPSSVRARMFGEKLKRRFVRRFQEFDRLRNAGQGGNGERRKLEDIVRELRYLPRIAKKDLMQRREGKATTIVVLIKALRDVCGSQDMFVLDAIRAVNFNDPSWAMTTDEVREVTQILQRIEAALRSITAPSLYTATVRDITNAVQAKAPRRRGT